MRREFPGWNIGKSQEFYHEFPKMRRRYNKGTLHANSQREVLYAFPYNDDGYIRHGTYHKQIISWRACKQELRLHKFADPRFFTEKEIENLKRFSAWHIPKEADIKAIEKEIKKPLYNSITFPSGYGPESKI